MAFTTILPTPVNLIGLDGQAGGAYEGPGFASVTMTSVEPIQHSIVNSGRLDMSRAANPHIWRVAISYNELECEQFHVVYSFLLRKQASLEPFYVQLPQYLNQGITDKTVTAAGGWGYNTIEVSDATSEVRPNTVFLCPYEKLYYVTRVETPTNYLSSAGAPAAGRSRLHVSPTFQNSITSGTLDFTDPLLKVQLVNALQYSVNDLGLYSFGITVEEVRI